MPSILECQRLVWELEEQKGFGHDLNDKLLWMGEEYGELIHAFKHGDMNKLAEEATDITFFTATSLQSLKQNGDQLAARMRWFIDAKEPVTQTIRELGKIYGKILEAADQMEIFGEDNNSAELEVNALARQLIRMHLLSQQIVRLTKHDPDTEFLRKLEKNRERVPVVHGIVKHFDRE